MLATWRGVVRIVTESHTVNINCNFTPNLVAAGLPLILCNLLTALKSMLRSIVLIGRITTSHNNNNFKIYHWSKVRPKLVQ